MNDERKHKYKYEKNVLLWKANDAWKGTTHTIDISVSSKNENDQLYRRRKDEYIRIYLLISIRDITGKDKIKNSKIKLHYQN